MAHSSTKRVTVEHCWTLVGQHQGGFWYARRMRPTQGEPTTVAFDHDWVLHREETKGDVLGFYHTHPSGKPTPSQRDHRTMHAWVSCLGKTLLCLIEAEGDVLAYQYEDDESPGAVLTACELFPRGMVIAYDDQEENDGK